MENKNTSNTSNNKLNTNTSTSKDTLDSSKSYDYDCDKLYEELKAICGDPKFRPYYIKQFYRLGRKQVLRLAGIAKGDNINFGWLVSNESQRRKTAYPQT